MQMEEQILARAELSKVVGVGDTAAGFGPHFPAAAATPFVLGLAEVACHNAVAEDLQAGEVTVGVRATIEHLSPSPVGATLTAKARLVRREGRILSFAVEVMDAGDVCATVVHDRAVVLSEKISQRLAAR
jgi:fluoroacetyl-CoA thioesterase